MTNQTSIKETILQLERESCRKFLAGDFEGVVSYLADNILLLNPDTDIILGKDHELDALREVSKIKDFEMSWEPTDAHVSKSEDLAYVYGTIMMKTPDNQELSEKYVTIWEKKDERWEIVLQMRNSNPK